MRNVQRAISPAASVKHFSVMCVDYIFSSALKIIKVLVHSHQIIIIEYIMYVHNSFSLVLI